MHVLSTVPDMQDFDGGKAFIRSRTLRRSSKTLVLFCFSKYDGIRARPVASFFDPTSYPTRNCASSKLD